MEGSLLTVSVSERVTFSAVADTDAAPSSNMATTAEIHNRGERPACAIVPLAEFGCTARPWTDPANRIATADQAVVSEWRSHQRLLCSDTRTLSTSCFVPESCVCPHIRYPIKQHPDGSVLVGLLSLAIAHTRERFPRTATDHAHTLLQPHRSLAGDTTLCSRPSSAPTPELLSYGRACLSCICGSCLGAPVFWDGFLFGRVC